MATTVKLVLRRSKRKRDGTCPVWIRITANRKTRFVSTGIYVAPKYWNANRERVRGSHEVAAALNKKLTTLKTQAQTEALEAGSAQAVKVALSGSGGSLSRYFEAFIEDLDAQGRFWDWKKYRVTLGKLKACFGEMIDWNAIDRPGLIRFERHLREQCGNSPNTVRKELQRVSRVFRQAVKDDVLKPEANPFLIYDRPKAAKVHRRKLSLEEIEALEACPLSFGSDLCTARDAFVFAFYGGGVRFSDLCRLKQEHVREDRLSYQMAKTGTLISVPLPPPALTLIAPYCEQASRDTFLFGYLKPGDDTDPVRVRRRISSHNALVNRRLKDVAELAGVEAEGLSMHVARHSFADFARRKSGNLYAISKTLGHSSLQVTQAYLKSFDRDAVDQLASELWET